MTTIHARQDGRK